MDKIELSCSDLPNNPLQSSDTLATGQEGCRRAGPCLAAAHAEPQGRGDAFARRGVQPGPRRWGAAIIAPGLARRRAQPHREPSGGPGHPRCTLNPRSGLAPAKRQFHDTQARTPEVRAGSGEAGESSCEGTKRSDLTATPLRVARRTAALEGFLETLHLTCEPVVEPSTVR